MENKGCITCRKCEQVRSNFFCGRTRLSQKQLYNKHGFCTDYEPKEQIEKPMTNEEWIKSLDTEGLVDYLYEVHKGGSSVERQRWIEEHKERIKMQFRGWLKEKHENDL